MLPAKSLKLGLRIIVYILSAVAFPPPRRDLGSAKVAFHQGYRRGVRAEAHKAPATRSEPVVLYRVCPRSAELFPTEKYQGLSFWGPLIC